MKPPLLPAALLFLLLGAINVYAQIFTNVNDILCITTQGPYV